MKMVHSLIFNTLSE